MLVRIALSAVMVLGLQSLAFAAGGCTDETLNVRGTPLSVSYCVTRTARAGSEIIVTVAQRFSSSRGSFSQTEPLQFVAGIDRSRTISDVNLAQAGIAGTVHLTLSYNGGLIHVDSAMLTPGAITIK